MSIEFFNPFSVLPFYDDDDDDDDYEVVEKSVIRSAPNGANLRSTNPSIAKVKTLREKFEDEQWGNLPAPKELDRQALKEKAEKRLSQIKILSNKEEMLTGETVNAILKKIAVIQKLQIIDQFFEARYVDTFSCDSICSIIKNKNLDPSIPICIPVCFGPYDYVIYKGVPHIAVILIVDGVIEYYDSQNYGSNTRNLSDSGKTLGHVLAYLSGLYRVEIAENENRHQLDRHSCGVFVTRYVYSRLIERRSRQELFAEPELSEQQIHAFRQLMIDFLSNEDVRL